MNVEITHFQTNGSGYCYFKCQDQVFVGVGGLDSLDGADGSKRKQGARVGR